MAEIKARTPPELHLNYTLGSASASLLAWLAVFLTVAFVLTGSPAKAQQPYCLPDEPRIAALCAALDTPNEGFTPPRLLQQAIDLIAQVISTRTTNLPQDLLAASMDGQIVTYLDEHRAELDGRASDYCKALAAKTNGRFTSATLATACLRPVCLLPLLKNGRPLQCAGINAGDAAILLNYAQATGREVFGPCDQKQPDCQHVAGDAAELVVLVDELQPFFRAAFQTGQIAKCGSTAACVEALADFVRWGLGILGQGVALDLVLSRDAGLAAKLDHDGAFHSAWLHIQEEEREFTKPQKARIFPWDIGLFTALRTLEPKLDAVKATSADYLVQAYRDQLVALWKRGEGLVQVVQQNPKLKSYPAIAAFSEAWTTSVSGPLGLDVDVTRIDSAAENIRRLQDQLKLAEAELKQRIGERAVNLVIGGSADAAVSCSAGTSTADWTRGLLDFCFPTDAQKIWLSGLRFAFAPCGPGLHACQTTGDVRVLLPLAMGDTEHSWIAIPTGVGSIPAQVTEAGIAITTLAPFRPLSVRRDNVISWLQRMLPSPLKVVDFAKIEVRDGPELDIVDLRIAIPSLGLPDLNIPSMTLSRTGLSVEDGIQVGKTDFESAVRRILAAALLGHAKLAGLNVASAHLLVDDERCGTVNYRMNEYPYGFCVTTDFGLGSASLELKIEVLVDNGAHLTFRPAFDPASIAMPINRALAQMLPRPFDVEAITVDHDGLNLSLQGPGTPPCAFQIRLPLAGGIIQASDLLSRNPEFLRCQAGAFVQEASLHAFSLLGLDFSEVRANRVCLRGEQEICIVGPKVSPDGLHVDFSHARLDDGGRLSKLIADRLTGFLPPIPATVSAVEIRGGALFVETIWSLPGFDAPIHVPIQVGGDHPVNVDLKSALVPQIAAKLRGMSGTWGALKMVIAEVELSGSNELWVHGDVSFDAVPPLRIDVRILPSIQVRAPSVQTMAAQIFNIALKWGRQGDSGTPQLIVGPDNSLMLRVPILATVPIGGFDGIHVGATLEAGIGQPFRFAGPVTLSLPIWIPTGPEIDIGDLQAMVDLSSSGFGIGASVALTPGEGTHDLFAFRGNLSIQRANNTVTLNGDLDALHIPLSTVEGVWQTRDGILRIDTKTAGGNLLPFPQASITIDGPGCAIVGKASEKLAGIELARGEAAALFPRPPCSANPNATPETADLERSCGMPGTRGLVCLNGQASLGDIVQAMVRFNSYMLIPFPHATARISLKPIGDVDVAASASITKLAAKIFGFEVAVYLPSLEHVSASTVIDLLSSLLRPSFDLEALLSGKIVISPSHGHGDGGGNGGGGDAGGGSEGDGNGGGGGPSQGGNVPQQIGGNPILTTVPGKYALTAEDVPGWPGAQRLVIGLGNRRNPYYGGRVFFRRADAGQFVGRKLFAIPTIVGELADHRPFVLVCNALPCGGGNLSIVPLLKPPNERSFGQLITALPTLAKSPVPLVDNGTIRMPALANYLAARLVAGGDMPTMYCVMRDNIGKCFAVLTRQDPAHWAVFSYSEIPVDPDSLIGAIVKRCAPACSNAVLAAITTALQTGILGFYEEPGQGLAVLAQSGGPWPPPGADQELVYRRYDASLEHMAQSKIVLRDNRAGGTPPFAKAPQRTWSALAHKLMAEKSDPDRWIMMRTLRAPGEFFALIGEQADRGSRVLISGVVMGNGSACVRSRTYGHLLKELDSNWVDDNPGATGGGISASALKAIHDSEDGAALLKGLSDPHESNDAYRLSPVLWMGNPEKPENCRWDNGND